MFYPYYFWISISIRHCRVVLPSTYVRPDEVDFVCSPSETDGMTKCVEIPQYVHNGQPCNASAVPFANNTPSNDSCVNWNRYYTVCDTGISNPFKGSISFDNIGLAWVAIFQVFVRSTFSYIPLFNNYLQWRLQDLGIRGGVGAATFKHGANHLLMGM